MQKLAPPIFNELFQILYIDSSFVVYLIIFTVKLAPVTNDYLF